MLPMKITAGMASVMSAMPDISDPGEPEGEVAHLSTDLKTKSRGQTVEILS